jgi:acyl carrier protein
LPGPSSTADPAIYVAEVLEVVQAMLVDVIGPEYLLDLRIDLGTSFDSDLELESLEFVALAERLLDHYGGQVDFVAWLATMELDEIISLTVGNLVAFIVASTTGEPVEASAPVAQGAPVAPAGSIAPVESVPAAGF